MGKVSQNHWKMWRLECVESWVRREAQEENCMGVKEGQEAHATNWDQGAVLEQAKKVSMWKNHS